MKRRGTSRRQVLELDASSNSLKASWQSKYQQICLEHVGNNSPTSAAQNGSDEDNAKLPKLVGYNSESEEEGKTDDLDSKVEDFLKEISDITTEDSAKQEKATSLNSDVSKPSEKSNVSSKTCKRKVKSKVSGPSPLGEQVTQSENFNLQPSIAWQECYDESSGCYYYWNTETNEVTWEMPQEVRAYQVALEQWNAQQLLLSQQVSGTGGIVPTYGKQPLNVNQQNKKHGSSKSQDKVKNKRTKLNSDSEDEKIELITSYGPTSDDEDSDSAVVSVQNTKKKKSDNKPSKKASKESVAIGPQLPPGYVLPVEEKKREIKPAATKEVVPTPANRQSLIVQKPVSQKLVPQNPIMAPKTNAENSLKNDVSNSTQNEKNKISALQRLKTLKNRDIDNSSSDSEESSSSSVVETTTKIETKGIQDDDEEDDDEDGDVEDSILERLKNQAKILQELGGEIPDEIKELISKSTMNITCSSPDRPKDSKGDAPIFDIPEESEVSDRSKSTKNQSKEKSERSAENVQPLTQNGSRSMYLMKKTVLTDTKEEKVNIDSEKEKNHITKSINKEQTFIIESNAKLVGNKIEPVLNDNGVQRPENDFEVQPAFTDIKKESAVNCKTEPVINNIIEQTVNNVVEPVVVENKINPPVSDAIKDAIILHEKAPNSFSLIAGYGNEEDSEGEEDKIEEKSKENEKSTPLFPIVGTEKGKLPAKNKKVIKLSAKAKELIHSSTTTEKARATDFVSTVDGLRPAGSVFKESGDVNNVELLHDFVEPVKKVSRKKRLEMPAIGLIKQAKPSLGKTNDTSNAEQVDGKETDSSVKVLTENPEAVVDYKNTKGGYIKAWAYNSELRGGEHRGFGYERDFSSDQAVATTSKAGMIQFIKAETLMPKNEPVVSVKEDRPSEEIVKEEEPNKIELDKANELAQVITEKVKFLCEGKETVPPVQVMAIQLETLSTAMAAGGLTVTYMLEWLQSVDTQLVSLEQAAAPLGWQCHWDRVYKRYYYRNDETGSTQWDYPSEQPVQGGEEAMELCDSPPPPLPPIAAPPLPSISPPPPPLTSPPVAPPPPRITSRSPSPTTLELDIVPVPPPPPVISDLPPLPPLPPSPPPPPPPPIISSLAHGEPLPPGVDMPEEMYGNKQPPLPPEPSEPVYSVGYQVPVPYDPFQMQPIADYSGSVYHTEAMFNPGGEAYVIARPPASVPVPPAPSSPCLASELDSFYNEVAALEPAPPPAPSIPSPPPPAVSPPPPQPTEPLKKKKKTKLTPALALKKKGVSSLVAKWQQVQQDVRREEAKEET